MCHKHVYSLILGAHMNTQIIVLWYFTILLPLLCPWSSWIIVVYCITTCTLKTRHSNACYISHSSGILLKLITYYLKLRKLPTDQAEICKKLSIGDMNLLSHSHISAQINEVTGNEEALGRLNSLLMECLRTDWNDKLFPVSCLYINMGYDNINDPIRSCTLPTFIRLTISTFQGYTL